MCILKCTNGRLKEGYIGRVHDSDLIIGFNTYITSIVNKVQFSTSDLDIFYQLIWDDNYIVT